MSPSFRRVTRDAFLAALLFAIGGLCAAYGAPTAAGLGATINPTLNTWELFIIGLFGFIVFGMLIYALVSIFTRGWGVAVTVFCSAIGLAYITNIRDALV